MDEVLNNIATYAYPDRAEHFLDMTVELWPTRLVITLSDDGIPFDPTAAAVPNVAAPLDDRQYGGLGIHLVRTVMDGLEYGRHDARNVLVLTKHLDSE